MKSQEETNEIARLEKELKLRNMQNQWLKDVIVELKQQILDLQRENTQPESDCNIIPSSK